MTKKRKTKCTCHAKPWTDENLACFSICFFLLSAETPFTDSHKGRRVRLQGSTQPVDRFGQGTFDDGVCASCNCRAAENTMF